MTTNHTKLQLVIGDAEMKCQAKLRLVILSTDLQETLSRTLSLSKTPAQDRCHPGFSDIVTFFSPVASDSLGPPGNN